MPTFFRVDDWNKSETYSNYFFYDTREQVDLHVSHLKPCKINDVVGLKPHTSVQPFQAATCDMQGFSDAMAADLIGECECYSAQTSVL